MILPTDRPLPAWSRWVVALGIAGLGVALAVCLLGTQRDDLLGPLVRDHLPELGVANPVTGVLLGFRGYDTLLEVGVLWLAWLGLRQLGPDPAPPPAHGDHVLDAYTRLVLPLMLLVAAYLVWQGADATGGAFQAAAVLAACGVLLLQAQPTALDRLPPLLDRALGSIGFAVFLAVGLTGLGRLGALLAYPTGAAKGWMLIIELAAAVALGWILLLLVAGLRPDRRADLPADDLRGPP